MIPPLEQFRTLNISFNTSMDCNLACRYCYETDKKGDILSLDTAKKFIDIILAGDPLRLSGTKDERLNNGVVLDFIGGDALMHPDLVESIVSYFIVEATLRKSRLAKRWKISISTNGTLFGHPKVKSFIEKYNKNLSVGISFDGSPTLHDMNRIFPDGSGSFEVIMNDWEWFKSIRGEQALQTKATLSKDSIPYIYDSLVFMHSSLGLTQINQNFIFEDTGATSENYEELDRQMGMCVEYVLKHRNDLYWSMLDETKFGKAGPYKPEADLEGTSCGSGLMPALAPNGKIYPCFRFLPHTSRNEYSCGDVDSGIDHARMAYIRSLTRDKVSESKCLECPVETACAWCIGGCFAETGEFKRQTYICEYIKIQCKHAKTYWRRFYNDN